MNRLNNTEYTNLFAEVEQAEVLDLAKLNALSYERMARMYETSAGKRSPRSAQNRRFISLISALEQKHHCKLVGRNQKDHSVVYEVREAGYSPYSWAK